MYRIDTNKPWPPLMNIGATKAALQSLKLGLPASPELYSAAKAIEAAIRELDRAERRAAYTRAGLKLRATPPARAE